MAYTIRTARQAAGKSTAEMAAALGISTAAYEKLERHPESVTVEQAQRLSRVTGIDIDSVDFFAPKLY